jgi:hypothetical protein
LTGIKLCQEEFGCRLPVFLLRRVALPPACQTTGPGARFNRSDQPERCSRSPASTREQQNLHSGEVKTSILVVVSDQVIHASEGWFLPTGDRLPVVGLSANGHLPTTGTPASPRHEGKIHPWIG